MKYLYLHGLGQKPDSWNSVIKENHLNNSYFHELMKTGHEANIEAPEELAIVLQRFYDSIR